MNGKSPPKAGGVVPNACGGSSQDACGDSPQDAYGDSPQDAYGDSPQDAYGDSPQDAYGVRPQDADDASTRNGDGAEARAHGGTADILVRRGGREFLMLGPGGPERELAILPPAGEGAAPRPQTGIPLLVGSGTGHALEALIQRLARDHGPDFCLIIADKERDIQAVSRVRERFADHAGIRWLDEPDQEEALKRLTLIQDELDGLPFQPLINPLYTRIDRAWYSSLAKAARASEKADFWSRARAPRFSGAAPRLLLLTSKYFLMGEIIAACERLGYPYKLLQTPTGEMGRGEFIESLLSAVVEFKPDFAFTINHLGVDREGLLTELTEKLRLPLASWFVDNPHLILYLYPRLSSPWTAIFTWDADNLASLREQGFSQVDYLPLGVDAGRFCPPREAAAFPGLPKNWDGRVAFVGNSMVHKVLSRKDKSLLPPALAESYQEAGAAFARSGRRSVRRFLAESRPDLLAAFEALPGVEDKLGYETMLTWEATRQYRLSCLRSMLPFAPLVIGDDGWKRLLQGETWRYHAEMSYYDDLPRFYPCAAVNFNCTSQQMKGAVNQRVFDVPACGAFLLTDYREQVERLFEPGREIICYHSPDEATSLAAEYLQRPQARRAVAEAARARILAEHTYEHRLAFLSARMREIYG